MKKLVTLCLSLLLCVSLFGCGPSAGGIADDFKITTDQSSEIFTEKEQMIFIDAFKEDFSKDLSGITLRSMGYAKDEEQTNQINYYKDIYDIDPSKKDVMLLDVTFQTGHFNVPKTLNSNTEYNWSYLVQMKDDGTITVLEHGYF